MPNMPEAIVAALGAAAIGAVWSSCSPDFGVQGVLDRFGQIEPTVLVAADGYVYGGKTHDCLGASRGRSLDALPTRRAHGRRAVSSDERRRSTACAARVAVERLLAGGAATSSQFEQLPFNHPLYILYSSGTTGVPKCIVHGAGGTLLQHLKEHQLHCDIRAGDRVFYFTTCGWMMWNWLVSALASEATLVLYDGSPFHPDGNVLFDLADAAGMTLFGTSAKFIDAVAEGRAVAARRRIGSTPCGRSRRPARRWRRRASTSSTSTSSATCTWRRSPAAPTSSAASSAAIPIGPVWRGEIQARGARHGGRGVRRAAGSPVRGEKGELVCTMPFPSMPVGLLERSGRRASTTPPTSSAIPDVWHHGDYVELTEHDGVIIYGRSDAVLNPGGVRIGTAEIYRQVEQLDEVVESLVIGQQWDDDERIVLFVRLRDGVTLTTSSRGRIRRRIRRNTTPRHVPARIVQVAEIPRTKSGKIVELAVRDVVHGREVKNREALANPEALEYFRDRAELRE